jgi:type IV secretion system protein VirB2
MQEQIIMLWKTYWVFCFAILLGFISPSFEVQADAGSKETEISNIICRATNQITGNIGRAVAVLIVISLAIALFLGKVTWGMAIAVAVGMGLLFGARDVVNMLSNGSACDTAY